MIEQVFRSTRVQRRLRMSLLGRTFDDFVAHLARRGHPVSTIHPYVQAVEHFDRWLRQSRGSIARVDEKLVDRFLQTHLPRCRCPTLRCKTVHQARAALRHLLVVLRATGRVPPRSESSATPAEKLVRAYVAHLTEERGAAQATCTYSARYAREFLADRFGRRQIDFSRIRPASILAFLTDRAGRWTPESMKVAASSLRRFFRYLQLIGSADRQLVLAVPPIAGWKLASIPRVLTDPQLRVLLRSFDRTTPIGLRGYATTLCLTQLGLRPCEVAALSLDDIDWRAGTIRIPATKTRRADLLPLPASVARAILAYLRRGRPTSTTRQIFVRHKTPAGVDTGPGIIRVAVRKGGIRAGLAGSVNPNVLRHTVATRMIRSGATMKDVADALRHRSIDTAAIYAKVDIAALRDVAAPWPRRTR